MECLSNSASFDEDPVLFYSYCTSVNLRITAEAYTWSVDQIVPVLMKILYYSTVTVPVLI